MKFHARFRPNSSQLSNMGSSQVRKERFMGSVKIAFLAAMSVLLASLLACRDSDEDEKGAPASAAGAAGKTAPAAGAGQQVIYNIDHDPPGQLPPQIHPSPTGPGSDRTSAVSSEP